MKKELITQKDPKSPVSEVFRTLRTNIQFMNTKGELNTLLITSTLPGEGKSWVASNLAVTFAQAGNKVIIVDADMRKGRQYSIFGVSPIPGLSNYLSGVKTIEENIYEEDLANYIQETEIENLYLLPSGNIPPNPSELLISEQMINLIDDLQDLCDIVIIDGTPNELVTDSLIISRLVDSTIIVTAHKQTKKDSLQRIITNIQNIGGKIAGVVVNKMPVSAKKYEQSYYYGSTESADIKSKKKELKNSNNSLDSKIIDSKPLNIGKGKEIDLRKDTEKSNEEKMINKNNVSIKKEIEMKIEENEKEVSYELELKPVKEKKVEKIGKKSNVKARAELKEIERKAKPENVDKKAKERTNDILNQINTYLEKENKK